MDTTSSSGAGAVLWGFALPPEGRTPLSAQDLLASWGRGAPERAPQASGFHAGLVITDTHGLVAGCDPLGLFPIYHWSGTDGITLVGTSPTLFRTHPAFTPRRSLEGLAGLLLTGGWLEGRADLDGVVRLAVGHLLVRARDGKPREVAQYALPPAHGPPASLEDAADALDDALARAAERHVPAGRPQDLLLSGGRDSRVLAGSLQRSRRAFGTITLGREGDLEARCAREVAGALGVSNRLLDVPLERYAELADLHVRVEGLVGHLAGMHNWGMGEALGLEHGSVTTGHMLGHVAGGVDLDWAGASRAGGLSEAALWETTARHALARPTLERLVRDPQLREAISEADRRMRARFQETRERLQDRVRLHVLTHWARYHPGAVPWRLSFFAWPSVPASDTELLAAAAPVAAAYSSGRVLQDAMLRRRYRRLACLPLVRSSGSLEPVMPGVRWKLARTVRRLGERLGMAGQESSQERLARDRYSRIYDLGNEGWIAIRKRAEPFRAQLLALFDEATLTELLPPPDRPLHLAQPITESYGRKCLLALMLQAGVA